MDDVHINLDELKLEESVFKDVKYYVSGHVQEKILEIFRIGGAERMNYFSDYVTHLVCGLDPDENDLTDATDVYEIPIVTSRWVITCAKLRKCISPKGFKYDTNQLFSGLTFTFSHIRDDKYNLWALITYHGGSVQHNLDSKCTHLLTFDVKTQKYLKAFSLNDRIKIVTPDFVIESVKAKQLVQCDLFHPKLLTWPKPRESTALITGFEQDDNEKCSDIPETESTQALLDQLKQRMPWNQPNTPKTITPPSTTYQSFLNPTPVETTTSKRVPWTPPTPTPSTTSSSQFNFNSQPDPPTTPKRVQWNNNHTPTTFQNTPNSSQSEVLPAKTYPPAIPEPVVEQPQSQPQQNIPPPQQLQTTQQQPQQLQTTQQQFLQRVQRQQLLNQAANNQFNNNQIQQPQQQQPQTTQIGNRTFIAATQQSHLSQNLQQPQQYKLQISQSHLPSQQPTTQQQPQQIGLIRQQQPQQMHQTGQPMIQTQNRLQTEQQLPFNSTQQVGQQFPLQQQQQQQQQQTVVNQQFGPRPPLQQEQIPFSNQNQQIQMNQQPQQQNQIYNQQPTQQFLQQKVQQRPMHPNWQAQQIVQQQQQLNQQQLQQQQLNPQLNQQLQQQLTQQQLNPGQINQQLQQRQLNQQLNQEQQLSQQLNPQLNQQQLQQQQQLNPQQISQQLQQRQLNQQQLNQDPQITQQQINPGQINQQQLNPGQINQQQLQQQLIPQQIGQQLNQQLNQQQLQQQQLQLNQQQIAQQQQQLNQVQLNQQQLQQPQINQPQQITTQLQLQQQQLNQQQIQLTPQQIQQRQALAQQQLAGQQINQTHLVQQQLLQQQQQIQRPIGAPRLNWSPNQPQGAMPQRQLIHLDAQTHQQLQQMDPQQRAIFVAKIQKQRQILLQQRQQHLLQQQQRGGHIAVIRGGMPPGLNPQQQMQWLQQQQQNAAKQQTIVMPQHSAPGLSPIAQGGQIMNDQQSQQIQIQRQQFQRLQQLQMQREQAQKQQLVQQVPTGAIIRPPLTPQEAPPTVVAVQGAGVDSAVPASPQQQLVVNAKTKTALANMLSIRLQSGGGNITPVDGEPSAAGTLRLMTAQHNAALNQTAARPQELIAIQQQRRTLGNITNATSDLPRVPSATPVPAGVTPQAEVKPQFSPGRVLAPPQHRHGPFYGHNPNLKLPPELFLLGCIFVVVEVERYLEETSPDWRQVIEKHGGEIEPVYCSRVTHVLCETQRHGVVMQAFRDFKRCVTLFWLDDVVKRKQVVPPWQALHLPTGYIDGAPAARHLISLSGFTGNDRTKVRDMITFTGAKFTKYFSRHNTVLVCAKAEGVKYQHAKKWNTPIVNVQWLTDLMLGNFSALNQIEHVKYQQFTQPVQFGFDTALVSNLMFAWKMPINISQESYERVKRTASPVAGPQKAKKPRLEPQSVIDDETPPKETSPTHRILFSLHKDKERISLEKIVKRLGGSIANSHEDATHLVMCHLGRSMKLLLGIAVGIYILPDKWLQDSDESQQFLPESDFKFDTKDFNATYSCDFYATLALKHRDKLFANKVFFLTPSVFPTYAVLKDLIERSGGLVEKNRRSLQQIEAANATVPYSYVILTTENDLHLVYDCLRNTKGDKRCVSSSEVVLTAILNQKITPDKYLVKVY